jgi:hypothetical protein
MVVMVQGSGPWQGTLKQPSPKQEDKGKVLLLYQVLTLSVTVAMIRAFGTRSAVLVFFIKVTEKAGIVI